MQSFGNAKPAQRNVQHAPYARRKGCPLVGYRKIRTPHKEFPGPRPWISFRIPTERSEAKRCDGCDDSGTTCEADLGRRKGARGRGTGQGRVRGGSQDRRANVLPRGGCALAASDHWAARCNSNASRVFKSEANAQTGWNRLEMRNPRNASSMVKRLTAQYT